MDESNNNSSDRRNGKFVESGTEFSARVYSETPEPNAPDHPPAVKKRAKTKYIIGGILIIAALAAVTGFLARGEIMKLVNPKAYLDMAAVNTLKELDTDSPFLNLFQDIYAGSYSQTLSANLADISAPGVNLPAPLANAGFSLSTDVDRANEKSLSGLKLKAGGATILSADIFISDDSLAVRVPELYANYITAPTLNFVNKWNQSIVSVILGTINQNIDINNAYSAIFGKGGQSPEGNDTAALGKDLSNIFAGYYAKAPVKSAGKQTVAMSGGAPASLSLLTVSFTQSEFKGMLSDMANVIIDDAYSMVNNQGLARMRPPETVKGEIADSISKMSFSDPVVLKAYCDSRHRIVFTALDTNIISEGGQNTSLSAGISLSGNNKLGDILRIDSRIKNSVTAYDLTITSDKSASSGQYYSNAVNIGISDGNNNNSPLDITLNTSYDGAAASDNFKFTCESNGDGVSFSLEADGSVTKDDKAKSFAADFSDITFKSAQNGQNTAVSISGSYSLAAKTEDVTDPAGTVGLFTMGEQQLYAVIQEIYGKLQAIPAFSDLMA